MPSQMPAAERQYLSIAEVVKRTGLSRWVVERAIRDGQFRAGAVGRQALVSIADLDAWIYGRPSVSEPAR